MLTLDVYLNIVQQMQEKKIHMAMEKERNRNEREELKKRKVAQQEEDKCAREAQVAEVVEARAAKEVH